jgi:hypothetical protein
MPKSYLDPAMRCPNCRGRLIELDCLENEDGATHVCRSKEMHNNCVEAYEQPSGIRWLIVEL